MDLEMPPSAARWWAVWRGPERTTRDQLGRCYRCPGQGWWQLVLEDAHENLY